MTVRWRIILLDVVALAFIASMIAVMALGLSLAGDFVQRVDGVHRRFEVIAELDGDANNYAEQIAEVLLLGSEQMDDFVAARNEMQATFARLSEVTRAEVSTLRGIDEVQRELSDVETTSRLMELYRAIDRAAEQVFALQREGKQAEAVDIFRRDVEYRLSNDFEALIESSLRDERNEIATELAVVRRQQSRLLLWAGALAILALACGAALGLVLNRAIVRPVQALAAGARAIAGGRLDHRIRVEGNDEFSSLSRAFNEMAGAIEQQRTGLMQAQQRLGSEVEARTSELREANDRLRDIDSRRSQFLADVSHELRTPLTVLRGEADVALRSGDGAAEQRETLRRIQTQAAELGHLLDDLLAFARSDAEDQRLDLEETAAGKIVAAAVQEGEILAAAREVLIEPDLRNEGSRVNADIRRLKQALVIGLDNAVKHSPPGGRVRVETRAAEGWLTIGIADEGIGIDAEDQPHVFQRFYRGRSATARSAKGIGIGLSIAKEIVERHGGTITLENRSQGGALLRIAVPLATTADGGGIAT
jgi:signal transduction histidine kinase